MTDSATRTRSRRCSAAVALAAALVVCGRASMAAAEIIELTNGRTMSVAGHEVRGRSIVLFLRGGGEIICDRSLVARILEDEVPRATAAGASPSLQVPRTPSEAANGWLDTVIATAARHHGVDAGLIRAIIRVESAFDASARSPKGAMGLMQLMPAVADQYAVADPFDPWSNVEAGTRHLKTLLERYELPLALAAYNAGPGAVQRYGGIPPYRETRNYVARVLRLLSAAAP